MAVKQIYNRAYPASLTYDGPRVRVTGKAQIIDIPFIEQWAADQLSLDIENAVLSQDGVPLLLFCWYDPRPA